MINWDNVDHFELDEFSEDPELAESELIYTLDYARRLHGKKVRLSPVKGAFIRFGGSSGSQHFVGENKYNIERKSTAIDIFPEGTPIEFYSILLRVREIRGIGIYLDTNGVDGQPWIMFHIDIRECGFKVDVPLIWITIKTHGKNTYLYPQLKSEYWSLLQDDRLYENRIKH